jgi:MoxR-like ATPase
MLLEKLLEYANKEFEPYEVQATNSDLVKLMRYGIVKVVFKSNKRTVWTVIDPEKIKRLITLRNTKIRLPSDKPLFSSIIGYDIHKKLLLKCVNSEKPIHVLLLGKHSTAKTLFLLELTKIEGTEYLTPYITYVGLFDVLETHPKLLLIDQLDNLKDNKVYRLLIDLCEYGYLTKITHNETVRDKTDVKVIATANTVKRIPDALLSRFLIVKFREYSDIEYINIANTLLKDYNIDSELKEYIIQKTLPYKDIRNVFKLANICNSKEEVDQFISILNFI